MNKWSKGIIVLSVSLLFFSGLLLKGMLEQHPASAYAAPVAIMVYGQPDFTSHKLRSAGLDTLKNASALAADAHGGFYVADYGNSRVLHFAKAKGFGEKAYQAYGQSDFIGNSPHEGPQGLNYPHGVVAGPNNELYVSDTFNNRVLHYPSDNKKADQVYGQYSFFIVNKNTGGLSAHSLYHPQGLTLDKTGLYVADTENNRVLHFPSGSIYADRVYGQGALNNFISQASGSGQTGLFQPRDVAVDSTGLYVADSGNNRIVHYPLGSALADFVYGQTNFSPESIYPNRGQKQPDARALFDPTGIVLDRSGALYVADRDNNRVLYYAPRTSGQPNGPAAIALYGQRDYTMNDKSCTVSTFDGPGAVSVNGVGKLFVLDIFNQRVLEFAAVNR